MSDSVSMKQRLRDDLTTAIKGRDKLRSDTLRMVLSAITTAEVAGKEAVELSEEQVRDVLVREAKKRREAEDAYTEAGRTELAQQEHAEGEVLAEYLPAPFSSEEIELIVRSAIEMTGTAGAGPKAMGKVMFVVQPQTKGRADGSAVADEVRRQLGAAPA